MDSLVVREAYGYAMLDPAGEVVAGSYGTWRLTYVAGSKGLARGGQIRISTDSDTDWGLPQFHDSSGAEYMTLQAPEGVQVAPMVQGWRSLLLTMKGRRLAPGEKLVLTYGDRSRGGPGSRAQTFLEGKRYLSVAVDAEGNGQFVALPDPPYVSIVGGRAAKLIAIAPSQVVRGKPFRLLVKAEDEWGNPAKPYRGKVKLAASGVVLPATAYEFGPEDGGVHSFEGFVCTVAGVHRIAVRDEDGLVAKSNPILCVEESQKWSLYWGDPHGGQVVMATKIPDFFRYARDIAGVDFAGYQRNDHEVSKEDWALQQEAEREFYQPGRFVPLAGFEWSGTTEMGGHHNVYFRRFNQPIRRCGHEGVEDKSDVDTDLPHIRDVHQAYRYADVVITPHVGGGHADLTHHEPNLEPAIEITSTHGTFEWFLEEALKRGYRVGFIGGSDGYTGRPGAEYPGLQERRFAKGGLAAFYAPELTLEGLFAALKARRCYGTTGARMLVRIDADGHPMGEECSTRALPRLSAFVAGTAPLEAVELFRGLERIYSHPLALSPSKRRVRILWTGASRKTSYSGVIWEGSLTVDGGKVSSVEKIRFDTPRSYVYDVAEDGLRWYSVACGYPSGVIVGLEGEADAQFQLAVRTTLMARTLYGGFGDLPPGAMSYRPGEEVAFSFTLGELAAGPRELDLGPLNRKLIISLAPEPNGAETAEFTFTDSAPRPGVNPYWLRVVQTDMELAWTSPAFVDYMAT